MVARAKGLRETVVVGRHALKNALIPVVTVIGLQTGRLFGGAVVVETIFALPGLGRLAADSIFFRDFPMLQGVVLILALAVLLANLPGHPDNLMRGLNGRIWVGLVKPRGAFYLFPDLSELLSSDGFTTTTDFAQALLDESRVAVTPGEAFDAPGFVRMSYATSMDNLREGSRRLLEFVAKHIPNPQPVR